MLEPTPKIPRVLVTGASGFVGRHMITELLAQGYAVAALVRNPGSLKRPEVAVYQGDILAPKSLVPAAEGCDAVIHLVGIIAETRHSTFEQIHVTGTRNVIEAAKAAGIKRIVHMSALGTRADAVATYHKTKWQAEQAVMASGLEYTIFRPSLILGPDGEFATMLRDWARGKAPPFLFMPYFGTGFLGQINPHKLQPIHVADLARLFCDALLISESVGKTYDVGGTHAVTWRELLALAARNYAPANKRPKPVIGMPTWWASFLASLPIPLPFNKDQIIMSQEENTCDLAPVKDDFPAFRPRPLAAALKA